MSAGLSENELSDSNGLFSNNEVEIYTSEEQGDSNEDEEYDFSLLAALEMRGLIRSNTSRQMANLGRKVP